MPRPSSKRNGNCFQQADAIICVSASSRADLLHFYNGLEKKSHVVHHGFSPLPVPSDERNTKMSQAPYLLYVGSRAGYKNFALLLEAFSRSGLAEQYHLMAVGGGPLTVKEEQSIAAFQLAASVTVIPKAGEELLAQAYRGAALFIYPSLYEGFGFSSPRSHEPGLSRFSEPDFVPARDLWRCRLLFRKR